MRVGTLLLLAQLAVLGGCGGRQTTIGSSVGESEPEAAPAAGGSAPVGGGPSVAAPVAEELDPTLPPPPDPALVKSLVEKTGESSASDNPLHLRLEVSPRPAGELWLLAVVNRGTEAASVTFDLRRLTLTLEKPDDSGKPHPAWKKPSKVVCRLPEAFGGPDLDREPLVLAPGEGLVQSFDPRLYCISSNGESLLVAGQLLTPKLGFTPKPPRVLWKQGKRVEGPSPQVAPFIAEPVAQVAEPDPEHELRIKQLTASAFLLTPDLVGEETAADPTLPLELRLLRGSDAGTELTATVALEVRGKRPKSMVYFRRELVSFEVHGPEGIRGCDPQPDDRAPDRQAYTALGNGQRLTAISLLAELCPKLTFGRPGLYLVSARFDAERDGAEFGLQAFTGRLESRRQALVRIRTGELPALPPPEPIRVRVGEP
jgi:hypothetical protein